MCGICGFVNLDGAAVDPLTLSRMNGRLRHRGPDSEGYFIAQNTGLANRRLKVIDIEGGDQPIGCENRKIWTVFNGEIYEFKEIRKRLESSGHSFSTNTDTEVIVHLYEECGEGFLRQLKGMFAIALFDSQTGKLILARDRKGKKPLYFYHSEKLFAFASEVKALFDHPAIPREANPDALHFFLALGYVPSPFSAFKNIWKLEPASFLVLESGRIRISAYWSPSQVSGGGHCISREDIEERIKSSVYKRLHSDVPLGAFLSGGIDSSLVVSYAVEKVPNLKTFCVGFEDRTYDESGFAAEVASFLKTDHKVKLVDSASVFKLADRAAAILDEPLSDTSFFPTLVLSDFTRKFVTVAISGDGGDELFLGYPTFQAEALTPYVLGIPVAIRRGIVNAMSRIPIRQAYYPPEYRFLQFMKGIEYGLAARNQTWITGFTPDEISRITMRDSSFVFDFMKKSISKVGFDDGLDALRWLYFRFYLGDGVLAKVDRASMASSLEVRCPLLDDDLVDFIFKQSASALFSLFRTKPVLRELARSRLPYGIVRRAKHGFSMPVGKMLRNQAKRQLLGLMESFPFPLNRKILKRHIAEHLSNRRDNSKKLWPLMVYNQWFSRWGK